MIATFLAADRRPCREFEVLDRAARSRAQGIACRGAAGEWSVAFVAAEPLVAGGADAGYRPAGGARDVLGAALDSLGAGPSLTPEEEARLLASGWQRADP